jgi:hypothetical protein
MVPETSNEVQEAEARPMDTIIWADGTESAGPGKSQWHESDVEPIRQEETRAPPRGGMVSLAGRWMR